MAELRSLALCRVLFLFSFLLIFSSCASAYVGLSPPSHSTTFAPNEKQTFYFNYLSDDPGVSFSIDVDGDLQKYVTLNTQKLSGPGQVLATIQFPAKIDVPGWHEVYIVATEKPVASQGIGVTGAVRGVIRIFVPYPGQYIDLKLVGSDANAGEPVSTDLEVANRGTQSVVVTPRVELHDSQNKVAATYNFDPITMDPSTSAHFNHTFATSGFLPGNYKAVAFVEYGGGKTQTSETPFRLGELLIDIVGYSEYFRKNMINPIYIDIQSHWNEPIDGVYGTIEIAGANNSAPQQTPTVNLERWGSQKLAGYIDTTSVEGNTFQAYLTVFYEGKRTEKLVTLKIKQEQNYTLILIVGGVVVVVLLLIGLLIWLSIQVRRLKQRPEGSRGTKRRTR